MGHFDAILQRCAALAHIKQLQAHLTTAGLFQTCPSARTKLVELCAVSPFGDLDHALSMFRRTHRPTTNDWNAAIRGLAQSDDPNRSIFLYFEMACLAFPKADALTCSFALQACARVSALPASALIHARLLRLGFRADFILQTTLVDAYAKGGDLDSAEKLFDEMPVRDVPTWNALISGFALGSRPHDALALFHRMRRTTGRDVDDARASRPNVVTLLGALSACAQLGDLGEGESVHEYARQTGLDSHVRVSNALIDMYAKCGSLDRAVEIFRGMTAARSRVSWNAVIMALAMHGRGTHALELFNEMTTAAGGEAVRPDAVTYLAVLSGCNHAGLVDEGLRIFRGMRHVSPTVKHYGCVVDMLGRAGRLPEAYDIITWMPLEPDAVLWQTLLGACKTHGDVALAERVSRNLWEMGSDGCGDYVLLSNVYAAAERWSDVGRVRESMRKRDVRKIPGFSCIQVGGEVHRFLNGDKWHGRWREIYRAVEEMGARVRALGYEPETGFVLHDVGEEDKENALWHHSEKLAIAFGLVGTPEGAALQVVKNLRICGDCHEVAKLVSAAYGREIVVRDRSRFHRFEAGRCSCGDYW